MNYNTQKRVIDKYNEKRIELEHILFVVNDVLSGLNESAACIKHNVKKSAFRHFMESNFVLEKSDLTFIDPIEPIEYPTWEDSLFAAILNDTGNYKKSYIAEDFAENIEYALSLLSERERTIIILRYKEDFTYKEISEKIGLSVERIRAIEHKALRKLRHPKYMQRLVRGYKNVCDNNYIDDVLKQKYIEYECLFARKATELIDLQRSIDGLSSLAERKSYKKAFDDFCEKEGLNVLLTDIIKNPMHRCANVKLDYVDFSARTFNCLKRAGCTTVKDVVQLVHDNKLLHIRNLGRKTADEIIRKLIDYGYDENELRGMYGDFFM